MNLRFFKILLIIQFIFVYIILSLLLLLHLSGFQVFYIYEKLSVCLFIIYFFVTKKKSLYIIKYISLRRYKQNNNFLTS